MSDNLLYNKKGTKDGILCGVAPDGREIRLDADELRSLTIIDDREYRLRKTVTEFVRSLLDNDFEVIAFDRDYIGFDDENLKKYDYAEFGEVAGGLKKEICDRYGAFNAADVWNIKEYRKHGGEMKRMALVFGTLGIENEFAELYESAGIAWLEAKGKAAGVFTCIYGNGTGAIDSELIISKLPQTLDYVDYRHCEETLSFDEDFCRALQLVISERKASTAFLQRKLDLGYNKAYRYIEIMERYGFIERDQTSRATIVPVMRVTLPADAVAEEVIKSVPCYFG